MSQLDDNLQYGRHN